MIRLFDVLFVFTRFMRLDIFLDLDYLKSALPIAIGSFFGSLLQYFGTIFEMYNLQVASSEFQVLKVLC
jgi:hypothetical protein